MNKNSILTTLALMLSFASFAIGPVTGSSFVCLGSATLLSDTTSGGTWASSDTAIATVSAGGTVTGVAAGIAAIFYISGGDTVAASITVRALPSISGFSSVCATSTINLHGAPGGGTWSGGSAGIATISTFGNITGIAAGTASFYYTQYGCAADYVVTVTPFPAISGDSSVCTGSNISLTGIPAGGTWSDGGWSFAHVGALTGVVTGAAPGTNDIYYITDGCYTYVPITVNLTPVISGATTACTGSSIDLYAEPSGGSWSSGNTVVASVSTTGVTTGLSAGTAIISYAVTGTGCSANYTITINATPAAISGASAVCAGDTIILSESVTGGTWISASNAIATVSATGVVTGVGNGNVNIYYSMGGTLSGCVAYHTVTVNAVPTITGPTSACTGVTIDLTGYHAGGTWSVGNSSIATVVAAGAITALSPGITNIYYVLGGCSASHTLTVNSAPSISGSSVVCTGSTITLTATPSGGTWSDGGYPFASINATTGVLTGVAAGVINIYYTASGCYALQQVTVNATPYISGVTSVCAGSIIDLTASPVGGVWSSANTAVATIGTTGVATSIMAGVVDLNYSVNGCSTSHMVTVNAAPGAISGSSAVCAGSVITLSDATTGGTWISSNISVATVSAGGVVTAIGEGTVNIYYTMSGTLSGCVAYQAVTVNPVPSVTGLTTVCAGLTLDLLGYPSGGAWSVGNTVVATANTAGVVTGLSAGATNISYTRNGCSAYLAITVNAFPAISGDSTVCTGQVIDLTGTPAGGTWSDGGRAFASANAATGAVTGIAPGVINIYYVITGCYTYVPITVNLTPVITGATAVCAGSSVSLTASVGGGTWSSGNTGIATVSTSGVVTALASGVTNIYYSNGGCAAFHTLTVNATPAAISGATAVCAGSSVTLTDAITGGSWVSSNTVLATISSGGVLTGAVAGTVNISYTFGTVTTGCVAYHTVTINAIPGISGLSEVCSGATLSLSASPAGGTWSSVNTAVAIAGSTGIVTGESAGVTNISYSINGCSTYHTVSVNASPSIAGDSLICTGTTFSFTGTPTGGAWTSGNAGIAPVSTAGLVTGSGPGVANIYYTNGGCTAYYTVTVDATPTAITGSNTVCAGLSTTLTDGVHGGSWISGNTAVATVSAIGVVTGLSSGVSNIYYTTSGAIGGCAVYYTLTVNAAPSISGTSTVCSGSTITLTGAPTAGSWSSSNAGIAIAGSAGVVTGASAGVANISYFEGGCYATQYVTVNATPGISGASALCSGTTITLSASPTGGTWSSGNTSIAIVGSTGIVSGESAGVTSINYSTNGCTANHTVTVDEAPAAISGGGSVCAGSAIALTETVTGGAWVSTNAAIATVGSTGIVTGAGAGVLNIYYTTGASLSGCTAYESVTVNAAPSIAGGFTICSGATITLTGAPAGGSWSSGNTGIAIAGSTGIVTGESAGVTNIYYTANGCSAYHSVTVSTTPAISGTSAVCAGAADTLTGTPTGGTWSNGGATIASVSSAGIVTTEMASSGFANIYYTVGGCYTYLHLTVNAMPAISGAATVCSGITISLAASAAGGSWSSGNTGVATVGSTGAVTGESAGATSISYVINGCSAYQTVTVSTAPAPIFGASSVCYGDTIDLTETTSGGTWITGNASLATVSPTGVVTTVGTGVLNVYYSMSASLTGCVVYHTVTVNVTPTISGVSTIFCTSTTIDLSATPSDGTWSGGSIGIATVSTAGVVTGISAGSATISYSYGTCATIHTVTVTAFPAMSGDSVVCTGSTIALTGTPSGGTWSDGGYSFASVNATTGVLTGIAPGSIRIYYITGSCNTSRYITVNLTPAIAGGTAVCTGATLSLDASATGGAWTTGASGAATVTGTGGVTAAVTGLTAGADSIYYTIDGCPAYHNVTVNPTPTISGDSAVCSSFAITLTATPTGGTWTGGGAGIVTVGDTGLVTGVDGGTTNVSYSLTGCIAYQPVTVNVSPVAITGPIEVATADSITLSVTTTGGTWYSADTALATVTDSGIVTGVALGNVDIYYETGSGCPAYSTIVVYHGSGRISNPISTIADITVYPNPASNSLNIAWPQAVSGNATMTITDMAGHEVYKSDMNVDASGKNQVDIAGLSDGLYFISIHCGANEYSGKLSVQN